MNFQEPFTIQIQPSTADGRILALDGGGGRGIIELEIMQETGTTIGLGMPLHGLFDLIIGTSIGE
jgi:patatin-like phospholipase/acyl hydrolase